MGNFSFKLQIAGFQLIKTCLTGMAFFKVCVACAFTSSSLNRPFLSDDEYGNLFFARGVRHPPSGAMCTLKLVPLNVCVR